MRINAALSREAKAVFFSLLRAGLWERSIIHSLDIDDFVSDEVHRLAEEQSVVGLIASGIEQLSNNDVPKKNRISILSCLLPIERTNRRMNIFVFDLIEKMSDLGICALLVKGQGIAQCYSRPLWRSSGDVDLLVDMKDYEKAKGYITSHALSYIEEDSDRLHLSSTIASWEVELHGTMRTGLGKSIDRVIDDIQFDLFKNRHFRIWKNEYNRTVLLPSCDNDIFLVFTHILLHLFKGGIGLRQVCDWCRLLWTYRDNVNSVLLESRLRSAGLMSEWKAFAYLAVNDLGMEEKAIPFYSSSLSWQWRAKKILSYILQTGNMGHNRDNSYISKYPYIVYKLISFFRYTCDSLRLCLIFPRDSVRVWFLRVKDSFLAVSKGK